MGSARTNQSPILYRISKVISRTHCHDLPFQESHNAVSIHQTTDRKRSCKYVYDYMSSILHQRCSVELVTYFHACTETCRWPLTPHPWNDHSIPYCQRGVSCSDPTLSYMLSHKSTKNKLLDHCNQPVQKEIQGTPRFPNICRNVGSLAVMASVPRGKTNRWSLEDLDVSQKTSKSLGCYPCVCIHWFMHVSFWQ